MVGVWEGLNLGSIPNFFPCFGIHPKIIDVHPKLIPKGGVIQFCPNIGVVWQKSEFSAKTRYFRPKKNPLLYPNHVLAMTGKSCSKKKSAFAQIIKGENVILGDFLG